MTSDPSRHLVHEGASGPGPGAGFEREPERAAMRNARVLLVAAVVVAQLWALTLVLDSWFRYRDGEMWLLIGFEALMFAVALALWSFGRRR